MTDIFISYAHEDEMRIQGIVHALEEKGWSTFWDRRIPAGQTWHGHIGKALSEARCVIVAWSRDSTTSEWVIEEANRAKGRGVLVPILLDSVEIPLGFSGIQAADLTRWNPGQSSPQFDQLIEDIAAVLGTTPSQEPAPPQPEPPKTRRYAPDPAQPKPPDPPGKKRPTLLIGAVAAVVLAIVVVWAVWSPQGSPGPTGTEQPRATSTRTVPTSPTDAPFRNPVPRGNPPSTPVLEFRVISSSQDILKGSYCFDLDAGRQADSGEADIFWEHVDDTVRYLNALNGAQFSYLGSADFDQISVDTLPAAAYGTRRLNGSANAANQLTDGSVGLVRTKKGNFCKLQIGKYGIAAPGDLPEWPKSALLIKWVTYSQQ